MAKGKHAAFEMKHRNSSAIAKGNLSSTKFKKNDKKKKVKAFKVAKKKEFGKHPCAKKFTDNKALTASYTSKDKSRNATGLKFSGNSSHASVDGLEIPSRAAESVRTGHSADQQWEKNRKWSKQKRKHKSKNDVEAERNVTLKTTVSQNGQPQKSTIENRQAYPPPSPLSSQALTPASKETALASKSAEDVHHKKHKRKKGSKKNQDGASNWMKLCTTLHIDATARKNKPIKRPAEDPIEKATSPEPKKARQEVWFDNVDKILIERETDGETVRSCSTGGISGASPDASDALVKPDSFKGVTSCVAMDCEMVGVGPKGEESMLARVSIVNHFGVCLYDKFVLPRERVTDYRTFVSGVTEENLATGEEFTKVQKEVSDVIRGRILVGHAVHNDLKVLYLTHPHKMVRDTSQYKPFRELFSGRLPSLKKLTDKVLGVSVQEGQHSSVQDAQATMRLYTMYRQRWEKELRGKRKIDKKKKNSKMKKKKKT